MVLRNGNSENQNDLFEIFCHLKICDPVNSPHPDGRRLELFVLKQSMVTCELLNLSTPNKTKYPKIPVG